MKKLNNKKKNNIVDVFSLTFDGKEVTAKGNILPYSAELLEVFRIAFIDFIIECENTEDLCK